MIRKNLIGVGIKYLLCAVLLSGYTSGSTHQVSPQVRSIAQRGANQYFVWVHLTDKSINNIPIPDHSPVTDRALWRRQVRGSLAAAEAANLDRPVASDYITAIKNTGARVRRISRWTNAISVEATAEQLDLIRQLNCVSAISAVRQLAAPQPVETPPASNINPLSKSSNAHSLDYGPALNQVSMLNVPAVHDLGFSGDSIIVLMLDTGFYTEHESIAPERIIAEWDFLNGDANTQDTSTDDFKYSQQGHGTGTYSVVGAYSPGNIISPAYRCNFLLAKTESMPYEERWEEDNYVAGLEWGDSLGADIVSSSLGYIDWYTADSLDGQTAVTTQAVLIATRLGIVVVTAAGNEGRSKGHTILAPADADSILTVGAVNSSGVLTTFSSYGPTADGRTKPEVVAQGQNVYMANTTTDSYRSGNGTSFATPLIAGCVALILEAHPAWTPIQVRRALMETASQANDPDSASGWGIVDVLAAINFIQPLNVDDIGGAEGLSTVLFYPNPYSPGAGRPARILWNFPGEQVNISIYDLLGREVKKFAAGTIVGSTSFWDGRNNFGQLVPSGIYFLKVETGVETQFSKLIIQH